MIGDEHGVKFPSVERPFGIAPRLAVDALGYVWRVFDDGMWSMAPVNPDNSPVPEPVTWYYPENPCEGCGAPFRPEHHIYGSTKCCPDCSHYNKPTTEKVEGE